MPVPAGCTLGGQEVKLCIHYEGGFTICRDEAGGSVLYRYPYEKLKMSADDGIRTLYLDFGGPEGELVRRDPHPGMRWDLGCPPAVSPFSLSLHRRWTCTPAPSPSSSCCTPSSRPKSPAWGCWCSRRPRPPSCLHNAKQPGKRGAPTAACHTGALGRGVPLCGSGSSALSPGPKSHL